MTSARSHEIMLCPATGKTCPAKEYIISILDGILRNTGDTRTNLALREPPKQVNPQAAVQARTHIAAELSDRTLAVEADLLADCNGGACAPVILIATRYMLYGTSIAELLREESPALEPPG